MKEGDAPCVRNTGAECETETGDREDRVDQSGDRARAAVRAAEAASAGTVASAAEIAAEIAGNAATEAATGRGTMGRSRPSARWGRWADQAR
jgi:hypothetical protein